MDKKILKNTKVWMTAILVVSFVLRFFLLGVNPPSLNWDEASIGYNAYSILKTGNDEYGSFMPLSFRSFDDFKPPVYVYLTVVSVAIFGLTEFAVRAPAALFGVLAVFVVYFFVKEIFSNEKTKKKEILALLSSFLLAISPWHLQFSRAAFEGNIGMFFLVTALLFFLKAFKKNVYFIPFILCFVLSMYSYHSFRLINPLMLVVLLVLFHKQLLKYKVKAVLALLAVVVLSVPIYASFLSSQGTGARLSMVTIFSDDATQKMAAQKTLIAKQNNDIVGQIIYNRRVVFIPQMIKGYTDHFQFGFLFLHGDGGLHHHAYNMGMLFLFEFPFIIFGLFTLIRRPSRRVLLLLALFFIAPLPASITSGTPQPIRAIAMIPAFHIFTAVGFLASVLFVKQMKFRLVYILLCIAVSTLNIAYFLNSYFVLTPIKYGYFWQYGNKEAISYAKMNEDKYDKIIMSYEYDQPYIYYLFYNKIEPSWYQKNWNYTKTGEVYRFYRKIGKYEFRNIDYQKDKELKKTLLIGTSKEINSDNSLDKILFPDGRIAYKIIAN